MNAIDEGIVPPEGNENPQQSENQPADNPAWNDFLGGIPESMHPMMKEHLSKWDEGVNQRISQVHSEYADWKSFKDSGLTPDVLQQAYGVFEAINNNPQEVYKILGESFGFNQTQPQTSQQGQNNPQQQIPNQPSGDEYENGQGGQYNPEIARLQAMTENMANIMLAQEKARQDREADVVLDSELKNAREKHGDFNEKFVLGLVNTGASVDDAVKAYQAMRNEIISSHNRPASPVVINGHGTGQLPSQQMDPTKLNRSETRKLVAEMFEATNRQG